jgi:hypothetical protein
MKNNRTTLNTNETSALVRRLSDPDLVSGVFRDLAESRVVSIVQVNPDVPEDRAVYEEIYNNPDKYTVLHEESRNAGRNSVVLIRYMRERECTPAIRAHSAESLLKRSRRSPNPKGKKMVGFAPPKARK